MRSLILAVCLATLVWFSGSCTSSSIFIPSAELVATAGCAADSLEPTSLVFEQVFQQLSTVTGAGPFSVMLNYAGTQYTLSGQVTVLKGSLADGFGPGDEVQVDWTLSGGVESGQGKFIAKFTSAAVVDVTGNGMVGDGTCVFTVTAINLMVNPNNGDAVGTIDFTAVDSGGSPLTGTITFDNSNIAQVNAMFEGESVSFSINLDDFTASI